MSDISTSSSSSIPANPSNISYILPSDDQLDYLVDKLCDTMPTMGITSPPCNLTKDSSVTSSAGSDSCDLDEFKNDVCEETPIKSTRLIANFNHVAKPAKHSDKRSVCNNDLNIAIMQCSGSLDLLSERRRNLELLVQQQHNVANINYNFSYAPRLPESPTRVDRLMYDISRERCRVLGLISALNKTIQSFSSKNTQNDLRKLLVSYGSSILAVMRERQSEVIYNQSKGTIGEYDLSKGILKLVELIGDVHRMNRAVHTALWCIEIRERFGVISERTRAGVTTGGGGVPNTAAKPSQNAGPPPPAVISVPNSWQCLQATSIPSQMRTMPLIRSTTTVAGGAGVPKALPQTAIFANRQQANVYQILHQHNRTQRGIQLYTEQQKAELCQKFYSSLKSSS